MIISSTMAFYLGGLPQITKAILIVLCFIFLVASTYIIHLVVEAKHEEDKRRKKREEERKKKEAPKLIHDPFYTDYKMDDESSDKKTRI